MAATPCVVVYGNSVFLAGIKADLERKAREYDAAHEHDAALQLVTLEAGSPNVTGLIRAWGQPFCLDSDDDRWHL